MIMYCRRKSSRNKINFRNIPKTNKSTHENNNALFVVVRTENAFLL